ncbi:MAG: BrnT family toxin [Terracidiphilus sp.]
MKKRFEWDPAKAAANLRKHRVSFETATRVFADPNALFEQDRIADGESRWQPLEP